MLWNNITLGNVGGVCCRIIAKLLWIWLALGMRGYKKWSALKGLRNFQSKIWPRHSLWRPRFPVTKMYFYYRVTFTGYIRCFYATMSNDLLTLTFWPWVFRAQCFSCPTHIPIFIILLLSVTELRVLNIWSHFRYLNSHCACAVSRDL